MTPPVYLIGFMGSGKSTAGKKLARLLKRSFTDLDTLIENKYRITIPDIFSRFDEAAFRKIEHETLKETLLFTNHVVATGGGTPCFYNNMDLIKTHGTSVYLNLHPASLYQRLLASKKKRPLIAQNPEDKIRKYIEETLAKREFFYQQATHTIKGENIDVKSLARLLLAEQH